MLLDADRPVGKLDRSGVVMAGRRDERAFGQVSANRGLQHERHVHDELVVLALRIGVSAVDVARRLVVALRSDRTRA